MARAGRRQHTAFAKRDADGTLDSRYDVNLAYIYHRENAMRLPRSSKTTTPIPLSQVKPPEPPEPFPVFVYFCQRVDGGPIKIGIATDPRQRLWELQTASPVKLRMLAIAEGGRPYESDLHKRFAAGRLLGEWFDADTPGLAEEIEAAKDALRLRMNLNLTMNNTLDTEQTA